MTYETEREKAEKWPRTEAEVAAVILPWLKDQKWEVWQEVRHFCTGPRADLVARRDGILWVIESKMTICLTLLDQAVEWTKWAHYVSVLVPRPRSKRGYTKPHSYAGRFMLEHFGIGLLMAHPPSLVGTHPGRVSEEKRPQLRRRAFTDHLAEALKEIPPNHAPAGNAEQKYYTPYRATCEAVQQYVKLHPGCTLKEVFDKVDHHYRSSATARSSMAKWIRMGKVPGVAAEKVDGKLRLKAVS